MKTSYKCLSSHFGATALGRRMVIAFTQDIAVRACLDGLNILLANSLFLAPAHTDKLL
jgi:hypothetical protein